MGWIGAAVVRNGSQYELMVLSIEGILRVGGIVLKFIVTPAIVVALFCVPLLRYGRARLEARLPVHRIDWLLRRL